MLSDLQIRGPIKRKITWPDGKNFAFTVFDDTDLSTLENVKPIYALLTDLGLRTTKSVWAIRGNGKPLAAGSTCEDPDYLNWVGHLKENGFEIGYHNATFHSSLRNQTITGIERFAELFGHYPHSMANHSGCQEGIYWGNYRMTGLHELIYNLLTGQRRKGLFRGHIEGDPYFWGDICKEKIKYVRNFVFPDINTLKACPIMPYHDPRRPYVNYWFASSEGSRVEVFNQCITESKQDRLEEERGACIMYTHFGAGFFRDGDINSRFKSLIKRLSRKNGWFVPVFTLLDYLLAVKGHHDITDKERRQMERKWLWHKIWLGSS
jgi:hypothetical protein